MNFSSKSIRSFLFVGVIAIWGIIIFRIVAANADPAPIVHIPETKIIESTSNNDEVFKLYANYSDPFLGTAADTIATISTAPAAELISASAPPQVKQDLKPDVSFIQYFGMISNAQSKAKVAIVSIHGVETLMKEKEQMEKVMLKKVLPETIFIVFEGKSYTIDKLRR